MKKLLLALLLTSCSGQFHFENDVIGPANNSDQYFTHGTKFSYYNEKDREKETYSIGQNIYTPSTKKRDSDPAILKVDRPFAGWLYGEYRDTRFVSDTIKDTYGFQLGCTGACSFARQTQQQVHRWINQNVPYWNPDYTLRNEWGVIGELERDYLLVRDTNYDFVLYGAGKFGNMVDSAALGIESRVGFNLDKFAPEPIIFKGPQEQPKTNYMAYAFVRAEERAVAYNHFLDGSLFHSDPHTVTSNPYVDELDIGFTVGYEKVKFTYRITWFSQEWEEHPGSFSFGGIDVSW